MGRVGIFNLKTSIAQLTAQPPAMEDAQTMTAKNILKDEIIGGFFCIKQKSRVRNDMKNQLDIRNPGTKQPPAEAGGFGLRTESPDTRRLNDASFYGSVLKSSFGFGSK
jgi:hypothetical protein